MVPTRFNIPGHAHELTFSCYRRRPLLDSDHAKDLLADAVNYAAIRHEFDVWAYVFMPEHVHILLFPHSQIYSIPAILKGIKQPVAQSYVAWCRESDPGRLERMRTGKDKPAYRFWQKGGGYDRNYWTPDEIVKQIVYIHMNPVRRGLVEKPGDWEWSSARFWIREGRSRIRIAKRYMSF